MGTEYFGQAYAGDPSAGRNGGCPDSMLDLLCVVADPEMTTMVVVGNGNLRCSPPLMYSLPSCFVTHQLL
jgi:hypothetical protein